MGVWYIYFIIFWYYWKTVFYYCVMLGPSSITTEGAMQTSITATGTLTMLETTASGISTEESIVESASGK